MKLIPLPGSDGRPAVWVSPAHIAAVVRVDQSTGESVQLRAEVKIEGMGLHRVNLGDHATAADADAAWSTFPGQLEG